MLDGPDAGTDRPLRTLGPVGVDGDERVVPAGFLDRGTDLRLAQLRRTGNAAPRQDGARADALDEVGAADQQSADPLTNLVDRPNDAEPELRREADVLGETDDVAAAPRRGDERAGALHPGADDVTGVDRVAKRAVHERPERSEVA